MKLVFLLLTVTSLHVSAIGFGQGITFSIKNASIVDAFKKIEKQSGYYFMYNKKQLEQAKPVTLHLLNATLKQALTECFEGQPFAYTVQNRFIIVKEKNSVSHNVISGETEVNVAPIDVKGRVLNESGAPVAGVTVTVKGTTISTVTDADGWFTLETIDKDAILIFTHVSMETFELKVSGKQDLVINLKPKISALGDVTITVNTGYQDIPKERATGSFVKVSNETLNEQVGTNILQRLDGVTSGLLFNVGKSNGNPQNNTNISIRGLSTINGPLDPLIVLDNFVFEGDINNINPNDIESITVLKDAAAASIWGARAGNGVIVITTKKGQFNQKLKVEFNGNLIIKEKPDLFYLPQMSPNDYVDMEEFLFNQGFFDDQISNSSYPALPPTVEVLLKRKNGLISPADSANQINALKSVDIRDQFNKYFYKEAITQQYALNFRGGNDKIAWLLSGAYDRNIGNLQEKYEKVNVRVENSFKPIKRLQINVGLLYTSTNTRNGKPRYDEVKVSGRNVPYLKLVDDDGQALGIASKYRESYIDTAGDGKLLDWRYYPLIDNEYNKTNSRLEEVIGNVGIQYQIFKGLDFAAKYQYQRQNILNASHSTIESFYTRDIINFYSQLDRSTGVVNYAVPLGGIYSASVANISSQNLRGQFNYNYKWQDQEIYAIAGVEIREVKDNSNGSLPIYGYIEDPLSYSLVDFVTRYPTFINGSRRNIPGSASFKNIVNRFVSFFSNFSYTYRGRYILTGSLRKDGSNIFGVKTNDKWRPLWSAGIGWDISRESFYGISALPKLKFRATIGASGNVDLSRSALPIATYGNNYVTNLPAAAINTLNNPELRWEISRQINIGVDFTLKNEILTGSIEYYRKKGLDLYGTSPYDYTAWGSRDVIVKNVANMIGNGVDLALQSKNLNRSFKWTTNLLLNYNSSKTTNYLEPRAQKISTLLGAGNSINPVVGKPLYAIAAYRWGGLDALGNPQGYLNGQLSTDYQAIADEGQAKGIEGNIIYIGPATPQVFGNLINTLSWKGFSLSFNISYKMGYYLQKPSISYGGLIEDGIGHKDYEKRWKKPGDELITSVPSFVYPVDTKRDNFYALSEINVIKGDHIRLQYINLSYSIHSKPSFVDYLQFYANAANLGILWRANNEDIDPDYVSTFPVPRSFAIGLRAGF